MKSTITHIIYFLIFTTSLSAQDCGPITFQSKFIHDNIEYNIMNGDEALNGLKYKVGIGQDGDIDTRDNASIIYASNVWVAGQDSSGAIDVSVGTYNSQDWVAGPLSDDYEDEGYNGQTDLQACLDWDRVYTVTKEDIMKARQVYLDGGPCEDIPESVLNWPGRSNPNLSFFNSESSPDYWDTDADGQYNPCNGDLPAMYYRFGPQNLEEYFLALPTQFAYYVMNDNGKASILSDGTTTQSQVNVYVFSYKTQELKDAIFVKYEVLNYSPTDKKDFRFGNWFDFDLGCTDNDYIGTDLERDMLYVYNSTAEEDCSFGESSLGGSQFGISVLDGMREPYLYDTIDGVFTLVPVSPFSSLYGADTLIRTGVQSSIIPTDCFNPVSSNTCDPQDAEEYYNLMLGLNTDGAPIYDNNGNESVNMFLGEPSDSEGWSMCNGGEVPTTTAVLSVGTGTHFWGQKTEIINAMFHSTDENVGCQNIAALQYKQMLAQKLVNNKFFHLLGPLPPTISMTEVSTGIELSLSDIPYGYTEVRPIAGEVSTEVYEFEGVKIYQVKSANFDMMELGNPELSQLFYQGDIQNGVDNIVNHEVKFTNGVKSFVPNSSVEGGNNGIVEELIFSQDLFTNLPIEMNKEYYFVAVSYAYNNDEQFDVVTGFGQQYPYLESTCGVKVVSSTMLLSSTEEVIADLGYRFQTFGGDWMIDNVADNLKVSLISTNGQNVGTWSLAKGNGLGSDLVGDLPNGIYFLRVVSKNGMDVNSHKILHLE